MPFYVPASDAVKKDYVKFKQHLMRYMGKISNYDDFNKDAHIICRNHNIDAEIKTHIIDVIWDSVGGSASLIKELGENDAPIDRHLDQNFTFGNSNLNVWKTWKYYTYAAVRYIYRQTGSIYDIMQLIDKVRWDDKCIVYVCSKLKNEEKIINLLKQIGVTLTVNTLIEAYRIHDYWLIGFHGMPITPECIYAASTPIFIPSNETDAFVLKLLANMPMTSDTLTLMLRVKQCTNFDEILKHVVPDQSHVKVACIHRRVDVLQRLLDHRLTIDVEMFELMFFTNTDIFEKATDAIEICIRAGYELTYETVVRLAYRGYYVDDIERFNFKLDNKLIEACILSNIHKYNLPYTVESLRIACMLPDITFAQKIIDTGVIPDRQCLVNALMIQSPAISLLLPHITLDAELTYILTKRGHIY